MEGSMVDYNRGIIEQFRTNQGQVGGYFAKMELLLLTYTGAKSGRTYTKPLAYTRDGEHYVIVASKGGSDANPDWYRSLLANPEVLVEVGAGKFRARATNVTGAERERLYEQHAQRFPVFHGYKRKTKREIPVLVLDKISE
jgi:deazaflavin-dependent oxidoreductase (nitroreductase family)